MVVFIIVGVAAGVVIVAVVIPLAKYICTSIRHKRQKKKRQRLLSTSSSVSREVDSASKSADGQVEEDLVTEKLESGACLMVKETMPSAPLEELDLPPSYQYLLSTGSIRVRVHNGPPTRL